MRVELTKSEAMALAMRLDHAPSCVWSYEPQTSYVTADGRRWKDIDTTIPYVEAVCSCGYFALRSASIAKILMAIETDE